MLAPFILANLAEARPNNENTQVSQKQVKKKQVKKKPVKKVQQKQILKPQPIINYSEYNINEETSSQFWAREKERQQQIASSLIIDKKQNNKKTTVEISKQCSWFTCNEKTSKLAYTEAKKWQGKSAKKNRGELKTLMAAGNNNTPVDPVRIPWCAGFVNAVLARSGYETSGSLMARSFLNYGVVIKEPDIGDIVVTKRGRNRLAGHVGFFEGYEYFEGVKYIKVYGGNTAKSVQVGYFPVNKILGYRKPVIS